MIFSVLCALATPALPASVYSFEATYDGSLGLNNPERTTDVDTAVAKRNLTGTTSFGTMFLEDFLPPAG